MSHWTDGLEADDGDESLVRPYTITRGRTSSERDDLSLITVITTVDPDLGSAAGARALQPEHRAILEQCRRPAAVAEVAAELDLPVSVTKILIGDLVAQNRVSARPPLAVAQGGLDATLLQAVRDGLRRL
ncbi:DUF742 domain-containing protein [Peterkaempfera bronchialis]|uniref:DUF742 domain-containing protein n=1 Tax=Peterkaempfera bronchialis TaxID=2126346 RepID=A0A345SSM0_9ACTN|nr:DUF742 domain-containing protein [Peterkaempfera bronchialis]AXI76725.1 DUF742 domain-containing protein [Peterkaempfera bronchialis]